MEGPKDPGPHPSAALSSMPVPVHLDRPRASPGSHCYHPFVRHPSADSESQSATGRRAVTGEMSEGCTPRRRRPPGRCATPRAPIQGPRTPRTLENPSGPAAAPRSAVTPGVHRRPACRGAPRPPPL